MYASIAHTAAGEQEKDCAERFFHDSMQSSLIINKLIMIHD